MADGDGVSGKAKHALRHLDEGDLSDDKIEGLGRGLMRVDTAMTDLGMRSRLTTADLNHDLGTVGRSRSE